MDPHTQGHGPMFDKVEPWHSRRFLGWGFGLPGWTAPWRVGCPLGVLLDPVRPGGSAILVRVAPWHLRCFPADVFALAIVPLGLLGLALRESGLGWGRGPEVRVGLGG